MAKVVMPWSSCGMRFVLSCLGPGYHSLRHTARVAVKITEDIDLLAEILRWYYVNPCGISRDLFPDALYAQVRSEKENGARIRDDRFVDDFCWPCRPSFSVCLSVCTDTWDYNDGRLPRCVENFMERHTPGRHHSVRAFQGRHIPGRLWKYVGGDEDKKLWWDVIEDMLSRDGWRHNSHECCKSRLRAQNKRSSGANATAVQPSLYALEVTDCRPASSSLDRRIYLSRLS